VRSDDDPAEHGSVGGRIEVSGALRLLDDLTAAVEETFVRCARPACDGVVLPGRSRSMRMSRENAHPAASQCSPYS
jgi:hypothetical protein